MVVTLVSSAERALESMWDGVRYCGAARSEVWDFVDGFKVFWR